MKKTNELDKYLASLIKKRGENTCNCIKNEKEATNTVRIFKNNLKDGNEYKSKTVQAYI